ncbi:MAG: radical SAM protein [Lachnospiraceae bacterium]|nr:radical SAM protein [Lachnospiraceae bacterium]
MFKERLEKSFEELKSIFNKVGEIVLYGNSVIAPVIKVAVEELGIELPVRLYDRLKPIDDVPENDLKKLFILCSAKKTVRDDMACDIFKNFPDPETSDFYAIYFVWLTKTCKRPCDPEKLAEACLLAMEEKTVPNIDSINTVYCNLRCRDCSNSVPQRKNKFHVNVKKHIDSLTRITDIMPITEVNFQGGEFFVAPNYMDFLREHVKNSRIVFFSVSTNGTILPPDSFFLFLKENGIMIRISDYGPLSVAREKIIAKAKLYSVPCILYPRASLWHRLGPIKKHGRSEIELKKICGECFFGTRDLMLIEDKIFCCMRGLAMEAEGIDTPALQSNVLMLDKNISYDELQKIVKGSQLWKLCDYCDHPMEVVEPAVQINGE